MARLTATRPAPFGRLSARGSGTFLAGAGPNITAEAHPLSRAYVGAPPLPAPAERSRARQWRQRTRTPLLTSRPKPITKRNTRAAVLTAYQLEGR